MSFAAEMKDFISAAQAGQKMAGAADDRAYKQAQTKYQQAQTEALNQKNNDTEGQKSDQTLKDLRIQQMKASIYNQGLQGQLTAAQVKMQLKMIDDQNKPPELPTSSTISPATPDNTPAMAPSPAPAQAVPADPAPANGIPAPPPQEPLSPDLSPAPTAQYRRGGAVQRFADGGAVGETPAPDDEEPDDEPAPAAPAPAAPAPQGAVPADDDEAAPAPAGGTADDTDFSSRSRSLGYSPAAGIDGLHAGLDYGSKALGLHAPAGVMTPGRQRATKAWATGAHAASPDEMAQVMKSVDPDNKLPESSRSLAAIGAMYQFKMAKGDPEGAAKAAFQMIQYYRQASQRYAVIAASAAQKGDLDTATHAAMKAYANVPDGQNFQVQKTPDGQLSYTMTDEKTGKVISRGIESPEKLASSAMGFAAKGFDESLMAAVQQRPFQQPKPAVDPDTAPMKSADKKTALKQIDDAFTEQNPDDPKTQAPKYSPEDKVALTGAAFRVATHSKNSRLTPAEAMSITTKLADPTVSDEASKPQVAKTDGGYKVKVGGKEVFMPEADFDALMVKRNAKLKSLAPPPKKDAPAGETLVGKAIDRMRSASRDKAENDKQAALRKTFTEPQIP